MEGIYGIEDSESIIKDFYLNGRPKGSPTHFKQLDNHWKWRKTDLNLWFGFANEGKSTFFKQLALIKFALDGWKFAFIAPEEAPAEDFFIDLLEMWTGKLFDKGVGVRMSKKEITEGLKILKDNIKLIDPKDGLSLDEILPRLEECKQKYNIDAVLIDPINQLDHDYNQFGREGLYWNRFLAILKNFAVKQDLCMNLVNHMNTEKVVTDPKDEQFNNYPRPRDTRVEGGAVFSRKCDNTIGVWRPNYINNRLDPSVVVLIDKIKKQKLLGVCGEVRFLYNPKTSRYSENGFNPLNK